MKEELKLINIGNGKFILCLNKDILEAEEKGKMDEFICNKLRNIEICNVCFIPLTIKEVNYDTNRSI